MKALSRLDELRSGREVLDELRAVVSLLPPSFKLPHHLLRLLVLELKTPVI